MKKVDFRESVGPRRSNASTAPAPTAPGAHLRALPSDMLEYLLPRLEVQPGQPPAPSVAIERLWELPDKTQARRLEKLERRLTRAAGRVEVGFRSASLEMKQTVLEALRDDDSLAPRVRECFRRYALLLQRYATSRQGASTESLEKLDGKIAKLIDNATKRAKSEDAHIQLLTVVEETQGLVGTRGSFTVLLKEWVYEFELAQQLFNDVARQSEQRAEAKEEERQQALAAEERARRIREEQGRAERLAQEAREAARRRHFKG